jgi:two-component system, OmpR family, phosphate regulon sensor histidine kinase PhoR
MRPLTVKIIIFISSFALLGLVFTQILWIREEKILAEKQFNHRADNALTDVVDELRNKVPAAIYDTTGVPVSQGIFDVLDTAVLSMLISKYVNYHRLDDQYYFGVVKTSNDSLVYRSAGYPEGRAAPDPYKACLSCIYKDAYYHIALYFPLKNKDVLSKQIAWIIVTLLFLTIIVSGVTIIIMTYLRQKKLTEMKNDFINNVTHEFKTPVSTIGLASEVLMNTSRANPERVRSYAKIIHDENERMRKQVERVLEIAQQDHHQIKLNFEKLDVHKMINSIIPNICLEKSDKEVNVNYRLEASNPVIDGDVMYVSSVISNITENALKYTQRKPELIIGTENIKEGILISFRDNGIGMSRESVKHIFNKFYRVPTGNVHNVKGFGLGLYYARVMTEAHGGYINVSSELNKGSRFDVYLPCAACEKT